MLASGLYGATDEAVLTAIGHGSRILSQPTSPVPCWCDRGGRSPACIGNCPVQLASFMLIS